MKNFIASSVAILALSASAFASPMARRQATPSASVSVSTAHPSGAALASGSAAPPKASSSSSSSSATSNEVTLQLTNDSNGLNTNSPVPLDNSIHAVAELFDGTAIDQNGHFLVTSAQLVGGIGQPVICIIADSGINIEVTLTDQQTFQFFEQNAQGQGQVVDLSAGTIQCSTY